MQKSLKHMWESWAQDGGVFCNRFDQDNPQVFILYGSSQYEQLAYTTDVLKDVTLKPYTIFFRSFISEHKPSWNHLAWPYMKAYTLNELLFELASMLELEFMQALELPQGWSIEALEKSLPEDILVLKKLLLQGHFDKIVLSRSITIPVEPLHKALYKMMILKNILNYLTRYPGYLYGFWSPQLSVDYPYEGIMGVTPELLFKTFSLLEDPTRKRFTTMALAGTQPVLVDNEEFLSNAKELHEHKLVIQSILEASSMCKLFQQFPTQVLKLGHLQHLMTWLTMEFAGSSVRLDTLHGWYTLMHILHPTAALGVYPRGVLLQREVIKLAGWDVRCFYGAPLGIVLPEGEACCVVGLRGVQWSETSCDLYAGFGIVSSSDPLQEAQEWKLKVHAILKMLGWKALC